MEIEKVDENKIKVTISLEDLLERNIDLETLNYDSPEAQELFWDMMDLAEIQFGFNASDSQLCIEAVPDSPESFVITITKLEHQNNEFESIQKYIKNKYKKSDLRLKKQTKKVCSPFMIYKFIKISDLKELVSRIEFLYSGESVLYNYKNEYYLLLTKSHWSSLLNIKTIEVLLSEYGKKVKNTACYEGILNEYGKKISENDGLNIVKSYY